MIYTNNEENIMNKDIKQELERIKRIKTWRKRECTVCGTIDFTKKVRTGLYLCEKCLGEMRKDLLA